jgi:hypothetical protein
MSPRATPIVVAAAGWSPEQPGVGEPRLEREVIEAPRPRGRASHGHRVGSDPGLRRAHLPPDDLADQGRVVPPWGGAGDSRRGDPAGRQPSGVHALRLPVPEPRWPDVAVPTIAERRLARYLSVHSLTVYGRSVSGPTTTRWTSARRVFWWSRCGPLM